jgi:hypothetical protein
MKTTKKSTKLTDLDDDLLPHYDVDYAKSRPNRFAKQAQENTFDMLDKRLSKVFRTPDDVKRALRSLLQAMPK